MKTKLALFLGAVIFTLSACIKDNVAVDVSYYQEGDYEILQQKLNLPELPYEYDFGNHSK